MGETGYIYYGTAQSNVPAELKVYYNVVGRSANNVTIDIDVGVHFTDSWSRNGCWVQVQGENRRCNLNVVSNQKYWYASSQSNSRSGYWKTVTLDASANSTSVGMSVGFSNTQHDVGNFQYANFELSIPIGNTNAYWVNPTCTVTPNGIITENTKELTVNWSGARDDQGNTICYQIEIWKNNSLVGYVGGDGTTATAGTVNISNDPGGTSYYFRTHCKDDITSSSGNFGVQSGVVTKNKFSMVSSFNVTSPAVITPNMDGKITCKHNLSSNSNGDTNIIYDLYTEFVNSNGTAVALAIYGAISERLSPETFSISTWNGEGKFPPMGIYIKEPDILAACALNASDSYKGKIRFVMTCTNRNGSSGTIVAEKELNWQYTPTAPEMPHFSTDSFFVLPNVDWNMYIINKRPIKWTWNAITDPNGTQVSYLVYSKTDNGAWVLETTTNTPAYTTQKKALTKEESYQIRIVAKFAYGALSPEFGCVGPKLTLRYYNAPIISMSVIERKSKSVIVKTTVKPSTSFANSIGSISLDYSGTITGNTVTISPPFQNSFEEVKEFDGLEEISSGYISASYTDSVMSAILGEEKSYSSAVVSVFSALLTIREKGVGINAIAGGFADFIAKGTMSLFGGDAKNMADGTINLSANSTSNINFYSGAYLDSKGNLRVAQDLEANEKVYQLQIAPTSTNAPPLKWRYMYHDYLSVKDEIFYPSFISTWFDFVDTTLKEADISNVLKAVYPVGAIYMSVNATVHPSTLFGGTWVTWGNGKVPVGVDTNQSEFNSVEKSGGNKYMQKHTHYPPVAVINGGNATQHRSIFATNSPFWSMADINNAVSEFGNGDSQNLQPYITCYMWKRTE